MPFLSPSELWNPGRAPPYPEGTASSNCNLLSKLPALTGRAGLQFFVCLFHHTSLGSLNFHDDVRSPEAKRTVSLLCGEGVCLVRELCV